MKDIIVEIYESREGKPSTKLSSWNWTNPEIKVKVS